MTEARLRAAAHVDRKTLIGLLDGTRWPQEETRLKVETALDWEPGSIQNLREGRDATPRAASAAADTDLMDMGPLAEVPTATLAEIVREGMAELERRITGGIRADPNGPPL